MISDALPRTTAGLQSLMESSVCVRSSPMPIPTGSSVQGFPAAARARAARVIVSPEIGMSVPMLM